MTSTPETRYARGADGDIAYQVVGDGDRTILFIQNWSSNIEAMWEEPTARRYFDRLGSLGRVIVFDKRGSGISDPVPLDRLPTLEQWMDDARLVLDAAGAHEAVLIGDTEGGPMAMLLAASSSRSTEGSSATRPATGSWRPSTAPAAPCAARP